jgi:cytochrome P450
VPHRLLLLEVEVFIRDGKAADPDDQTALPRALAIADIFAYSPDKRGQAVTTTRLMDGRACVLVPLLRTESSVTAEDIATHLDIYDPTFAQDPHAHWDELRSKCPVAHSEEQGGYWILTRYEDVAGAAQDAEHFSSRSITVPRDIGGEDFAARPPITFDPPRHIGYRRLILPGFSTRQVTRLRPELERLSRESIAQFINEGACDAAGDYARNIPVGVMCSLYGAPMSMEPQFRAWAHDIFGSSDMEQAGVAVQEISDYFEKQIDLRREAPTDDMIGLLLHSEVEGQRLTQKELIGALTLILVAGLDTVWSVLSNSLRHLATNKADRERLAREPELMPTAVEEFLRMFTPAAVGRITARPVVVNGTEIGEDETVLLAFPAANRDPEAFPEPNTVKLDRQPNRHVAFGYGPHRCVGAALARLELEVALTEWLAAIPEFELQEGAEIEYSVGQNWGPRSVPVRFPVN